MMFSSSGDYFTKSLLIFQSLFKYHLGSFPFLDYAGFYKHSSFAHESFFGYLRACERTICMYM